jgi:hypothetical protein
VIRDSVKKRAHKISIRWHDVEAKRAWMRALALLLDRLKGAS